MPMSDQANPEKAAFFAMIRADPKNNDTRLVFADWCEEHGDPELAAMLRGGSEKWLRDFAARINYRETYGRYRNPEEPDTDPTTDHDSEQYEYVRVSYEELIEAADRALDGGNNEDDDEFGNALYLNFDIPDFVYQQGPEFWRHFAVMTGRVVPDGQADIITFFRCAC
jgi:uncharacterized protein (TIGR02996 family)